MSDEFGDGGDGGVYHVGDALSELRSIESESAALVCLDDAWARPKRGDAYGVEYPTHDFETTTEIVEACRDVLKPGGWLIADADDWLLPRLVNYLREEWGDAAETYQNGFRKVGSVTLTARDGGPDRSTPGWYGANGGYSVIFADKGETGRRWSASIRQVARRPQERYGWGSVKPVAPYEAWLESITEPGERVVVPCAGTAPAAIAAERLGREWIAIDCEPEAREAFRHRRESELATEQKTLVTDGGRDQFGDGIDRSGLDNLSEYTIAPQHGTGLAELDPYIIEGVAYSPLKMTFLSNYDESLELRCDSCEWTTTVGELPEDSGRVQPDMCPDCAKEGELGFVRCESPADETFPSGWNDRSEDTDTETSGGCDNASG